MVDETSMLDVPLMNALTKSVLDHAGLLLVGDVNQLPSVGPGQVLADIIASGSVPVARPTVVFRQAAESRIVVNAHLINRGRMPEGALRGGRLPLDRDRRAGGRRRQAGQGGDEAHPGPASTSIRYATYRCSPRLNAGCSTRGTSTTNSRPC